MTTRTELVSSRNMETLPVRRWPAVLLSALVMLVPLQAQQAEALTADEIGFAAMVNEVRSHHEVRELKLSEQLSRLARRHSRVMANHGSLFHSDLRQLFRGFNYRMVGENVGYGGSLDQLVDAFLDSPPHRQNLLGHWRKTGVGVYLQGGRVWITQLFLR